MSPGALFISIFFITLARILPVDHVSRLYQRRMESCSLSGTESRYFAENLSAAATLHRIRASQNSSPVRFRELPPQVLRRIADAATIKSGHR
jgi:hypothetical protein